MSVKTINAVTKKDVVKVLATGNQQAWQTARRNGLGFAEQQMEWDMGALTSTLNDMMGQQIGDLVDILDIIRLVSRYDTLAQITGKRVA